jgi:predicted Zn-dependent protease
MHDGDEDLQRALQRVASGLAKSGNVAGALSMLNSLRREFPGNPHFRLAAANLLAKQGRIDAARQVACEAIALHPEEPGYLQVPSVTPIFLRSQSRLLALTGCGHHHCQL